MEKENILWPMVNIMKVNFMMTRNKDLVCITGLIDVNTMVSGKMANKKVLAFTPIKKAKFTTANGRMESVSSG